tara:strand:+ start:247 stop:717 length:471 start_codon:yes stop_codon:yes gene_type:complete
MAHYSFRKDLVDGQEGENEVILYLVENHNCQFISDNNTNSHDVILQFASGGVFGDGNRSFEIKTDLLITPKADTGNIFIEVESRGKESGVMVCQAEWFVYYLKNFKEVWAIKTEDLLALIATSNFRQVYGGDKGSGTKGLLINREKNRKHFVVLKM